MSWAARGCRSGETADTYCRLCGTAVGGGGRPTTAASCAFRASTSPASSMVPNSSARLLTMPLTWLASSARSSQSDQYAPARAQRLLRYEHDNPELCNLLSSIHFFAEPGPDAGTSLVFFVTPASYSCDICASISRSWAS